MAKIYDDSKTFVDMKLRYSPSETLRKFKEFMEKHNQKPSRNNVKVFVNDMFEKEGSEFEDWTPQDWTEMPKYVEKIEDKSLKKWAIELNGIWKQLGRKMKADVQKNPEYYSIIWVPNPVIVPGGRFREFYYWDSYWIVQGLLLSEMFDTVRGMLNNFIYIVDKYGLIPNGGRIYYLNRSQPPLLIPMIKLYLDYTHNTPFLAKHIHTLEAEFEYWLKNHTVSVQIKGVKYTLAVYGGTSWGARPESYSEDILSAKKLQGEDKKNAIYAELKAAAESGWDFSSRWFIANFSNKGD